MEKGKHTMGLFDSFYAELTCPNCGCQAVVDAQTKDFENAMLTFAIGQSVASLAQAEFHGLAGCRWCDASIAVPVLVREGRFVGFGEATLMAPQPVPLPPPPLKNPAKAGRIADVLRAVQACYHGEVYLGWDRGHHSIAVWHQGHWLHTLMWGTVEETLGSLAEAEGEGVTRHRVQRIEDALIRHAGGNPRKRLRDWGPGEIDLNYLKEVESKVQTVLRGIGVAFVDLTVTSHGKLCLTADGSSGESAFLTDVADTVAILLRAWVRSKTGVGRRVALFHDDSRLIQKTLERLEQALGIAESSDQASSEREPP